MRRLLIRSGALGDCILALPTMQQLAVWHYTEVWVPSNVVSLVQFGQRVRSLFATGINLVGIGDEPIPQQLQEELASFDSIVSWYGSSHAEFREALLTVNPRTQFLPALPPADSIGHAGTYFAEQAGVSDLLPKLAVPVFKQRKTMVIHPFSGGIRKNWPLISYQELAKRVTLPVEWTAGPEEELAGAKRFNNLLELATWIRGARLYLGNDSGITHLAAATGVPTVVIFGPTDPAKWAPRGNNVTVLRHQSLAELSVACVLDAVTQNLV